MKLTRKFLIVPVLTACVVFLTTSCQPEQLNSPDAAGFMGYPEEITLENWQDFVHAPQEVLEYQHKKEMIATERARRDEIMATLTPPSTQSKKLTSNYEGWVKGWSSGSWVMFPNTHVEATYTPTNTIFINEFTTTSTPYNWDNNSIATLAKFRWYFKNKTATYSQAEWVKGVSTLDLVYIQRHILGMTPFSSLREYIAADANMDGNINSTDISLIQQLILATSSSLPYYSGINCTNKNMPYFYIDAGDYVGINAEPNNGSAYLTLIYATNCPEYFPDPFTGQMADVLAYGIKRGDVSGNWTP